MSLFMLVLSFVMCAAIEALAPMMARVPGVPLWHVVLMAVAAPVLPIAAFYIWKCIR